MRSPLRAVLTLGAAVVLGTIVIGAQTAQRTMYVSVVDRGGDPVTGLGADAFVVREDGVQREVLRASRATTPMDVAILVDNSQAATATINDLRHALEPFVERLAADGHQVALIGLADRPTILTDYTSSAERLHSAVRRIFAFEGSGALALDGISDASRGLRRREGDRRVIVSITTEGRDFSNLGHEATLDSLRNSGAQLYALVIPIGGGLGTIMTEEGRNRGIVLDRGPQMTGGFTTHLVSSMSLAPALERLAAVLTQQYQVVFAHPAALVPAEKVEVDVTRDGLTARGILAPAPRGTR